MFFELFFRNRVILVVRLSFASESRLDEGNRLFHASGIAILDIHKIFKDFGVQFFGVQTK